MTSAVTQLSRAEVEVEAKTLRELLDRLAEAYPGIRPQIDRGISVVIDGLVYNDSWFTPVRPDSEVVLLPRIVGPRRALGMLLGGEPVSAEEARQIGLVNEVFPEEGFTDHASSWINRLLSLSGEALRQAKRAFRAAGPLPRVGGT